MNQGKIVQVIGPVVDVEFEPGKLPPIYSALEVPGRGQHRRLRVLREAGARGGPAPRREPGAHGGHGRDRRSHPRHAGQRHRRADLDPGGQGDARPHHQHHRRASRQDGPGEEHEDLPDPPARAAVRPAVHQGRDVRDRHQGRGPARALHPGRQDRPLRRRRRGQDRAHPGADQQHRQAARWHLGVRRGGGADPRGQRPLPRDEGVGRHREDRPDLRPDDRAARIAPARRR